MRQIQNRITENKDELAIYRKAPRFVPAGQSTQMIIGATPEHDYEIMRVAETLYQKFDLKRVFYSAFVNVNTTQTCRFCRVVRLFYVSTASIRQTGCCAIMILK